MKKIILISILLILNTKINAQERYLEDQLFMSLGYNALYNLPEGINQNGISTGFNIGYIRDFPLNDEGTFGMGIGITYSINSYFHNLRIILDDNEKTVFSQLKRENYDSNSFFTQYLEIPIQLRFRTSSYEDEDFFRLYAGIKFGILLDNKSEFNKGKITYQYNDINIFNNFRYGPTLTLGWGTFNIDLFWSISHIFDGDQKFNNKNLNLKEFNIGVIYFFL